MIIMMKKNIKYMHTNELILASQVQMFNLTLYLGFMKLLATGIPKPRRLERPYMELRVLK